MAQFSIIEGIKDLKLLAKELSTRLRDISFTDNFVSFTENDLTITAGSSLRVRNKLQTVPKTVILQYSVGGSDIGPSDISGESFTKEYIYIKNYGSATVTSVKLLIMKD